MENKQGNKNSLKSWLTLAALMVVVATLAGVSVGGGYWYFKNRLISNIKEEVSKDLSGSLGEEDFSLSNLGSDKDSGSDPANSIYKNEGLGFSLQIPKTWEDYKYKEVMLGGDFNVAEVNFYLPSEEAFDDSEIPEYFKLFTISIYVKESWNDNSRDKTMDGMLGEKVGENDSYVFLYSHFNGDAPGDISKQTIIDMEKVATDIKTFQSGNVEALVDDSYLNYEAYKDESIYYWNCQYRYGLYYPSNWSSKGVSNISKEVEFYGDDMVVKAEAHDFKGTLDEFSQFILSKQGGAVVDSRSKDRYGIKIIAYEASSPDGIMVFWEEEDKFIEFSIFGKGIKSNSYIVENMVATLIFNQYFPECVS